MNTYLEKEKKKKYVYLFDVYEHPVFLYAVTDENKEEYHDGFSLVHINTSQICNPIRFSFHMKSIFTLGTLSIFWY